jgi:hypothetical protein
MMTVVEAGTLLSAVRLPLSSGGPGIGRVYGGLFIGGAHTCPSKRPKLLSIPLSVVFKS